MKKSKKTVFLVMTVLMAAIGLFSLSERKAEAVGAQTALSGPPTTQDYQTDPAAAFRTDFGTVSVSAQNDGLELAMTGSVTPKAVFRSPLSATEPSTVVIEMIPSAGLYAHRVSFTQDSTAWWYPALLQFIPGANYYAIYTNPLSWSEGILYGYFEGGYTGPGNTDNLFRITLDPVGKSVSVNGGAPVDLSASIDVYPFANGNGPWVSFTTYSGAETDTAGMKIRRIGDFSFHLPDQTAPSLTVMSGPAKNVMLDHPAAFRYAATDNYTPNCKMFLKTTSGSAEPVWYAGDVFYPQTAGNYTVQLFAYDSSGNSSASSVYSFSVKDVNVDVRIIENSSAPLIGKTHSGSSGNVDGYENGYVLQLANGDCHMLITELYVNGNIAGQGTWSPARIGHWFSKNGTDWTRLGAIVGGNGVANDPKENTWSPSFYWNESENRWNILWRGVGHVFRYSSSVPGESGIDGPYTESAVILDYGSHSLVGPTNWDGGAFSSFGNVYSAADGRLCSFYSTVGEQNGNTFWASGLAVADSVDGRWHRNPLTDEAAFPQSENPVVYQYDGIYYAVYDDISDRKTIGFGYSLDGLLWKTQYIDLSQYCDWSANNGLVHSVRTPIGLIKDADGNFSLYFTAYHETQSYYSVGTIRVSIAVSEN